MALGLGAFTEGLQSGIETRNKMDFQRQYTERMRQINAEQQLELGGKYHEARGDYLTEHPGQEAEFDRIYGKKYQPAGDPAGIRMFKWLGQKMGFGQPDEEALPEQKPVVKNTATGVGGSAYADGGVVPRKYKDGGKVEDEDLRNHPMLQTGSGFISAAAEADVKEGADTALTRAGERAAGTIKGVTEDWRTAETGREYGAAIRGIPAAAVGALDLAQGAARDFVSPATDVVAGIALGHGGEKPAAKADANAPTGVDTGFRPTKSGGVEEDLFADAGKKAATDTAVGDETPSEAIAGKATAEAEADALRNLDYTNLAAQGVRPADLPSMNTADWGEHRRERFLGMKMQGMSTREAYEAMDMEVIETQMRGFDNELNKAFQYLQTGQQNAAMLAMTMAYQYFPNGSSVEFAAMDDPKTGRPVLVARGVSEETGEPVGTPQIITPDRINMMRTAATDPDKWRVWTKDNQQMQLDIAKHEETVRHHGVMEDVHTTGAITDRMEALMKGTGAGDSMTHAERRQRDVLYGKVLLDAGLTEEEFENPADIDTLGAAATMYEMVTGYSPNIVIDQIKQAFRSGGSGAVEKLIADEQAKRKKEAE